MAQQDTPKMTSIKYPVKKIRRFSDALALCCVDFPIYYVEAISERHFLIAGGGGSSKTGVHNQINVLEIIPSGNSCSAELVTKYQTPQEIPDAIMTGALITDSALHSRLVTSGANNAIVYNLNFEFSRRTYTIQNYDIYSSPKVSAEIKSVRCTPAGLILTGGIDGQLTVWNTRKGSDKVERSLKAHTKEIDEIDVDPVSDQIVTLSRGEGRYAIWSQKDFKLIKDFKKDIINDKSQNSGLNYIYRSCRYSYDTTASNPSDSCLLVACNPMPSKGPSLIYKWSTAGGEPKRLGYKAVTMDGIMSLEISKDGKMVAIGTRSGGIAAFEVGSMSQIYKLDGAHHNAVTGLEFLPPEQESLTLTNSHLNPFLSVSIDRQVILHRPKRGSFIFTLLKLLLLVIFMLYAFKRLQSHYRDYDP